MKTTLKASFLLAFCLLGSGGFAQEPELSPVALNSTPESVIQKEAQKPLTEVLKRLEKKYGIFFVYNTKALEGKQVFEPGTYPANPEELLQSLLNQVNLQFERLNQGNYAIKKRVKKEVTRIDRRQTSSTDETPLTEITPLSLISGNAIKLAHIAEVAVTGVVKAADTGEGLPGVSVTVKGSTTGTTTDADGTFKLTVPDGNATLVFSFIGYTPEEVPVGNQTTLNITLAPDIKALSEVVVIGYGTGQRKTLSSSISTVKAAEIQNIPNANLGSLLQGRAPGVQVIQNNGAPGAGASIRIRGISSLRAGNDPLYVVDEVPILGNLADINPNDIESIDILKDASAIAIYGARAANGVVLITTKRGKGRTKVTLNTTYGIQNIAKKLEVLEAPELLPVMTEIYTNAGLALDPFFFRLDSAVNVNWTDEILRNNAPIRTVDLSVSGKEGKVGYLTSINYFGQEGIIEKSGFNRVTGRLNLDVEVSKKIKVWQ